MQGKQDIDADDGRGRSGTHNMKWFPIKKPLPDEILHKDATKEVATRLPCHTTGQVDVFYKQLS